MISEKIIQDHFTEEAKSLLDQYLHQVKAVLKKNNFTEDEISASLIELNEHIIRLSRFKAGKEEIITTDDVKKSIDKLGDPEIISETLMSEISVSESIKATLEGSLGSIPSEPEEWIININAKDLLNLYSVLNWLITSFVIFVLFGYQEFVYFIPLVYLSSLILYYKIKTHKSYLTNSYIIENLSVSYHQILSPIVFLIGYLVSFQNNSRIAFMIPIIVILWFYLMASEDGRKYVTMIGRKIKNLQKK